jgi:hypothetical protein
VDFAFFQAFNKLQSTVMTILNRVTKVLAYLAGERAGLLTELAETKTALEVALGNDAADAEAIAAAQAATAEAQARADEALAQIAPLQELAELDAAEDAAIIEALAGFESEIDG